MTEEWCSLGDLAALVGGTVDGDQALRLRGLNALDLAGPDELSFFTGVKVLPQLAQSSAGAVLVPLDLPQVARPVIRVADPNLAAALIHQYFLRRPFQAGIDPSACIGGGCVIPEQVRIGALVCLGAGVVLGERVILHPGVVLGDGVEIGADTELHANVTVASGCRLGSRVIVHSGTAIGSDGFGYATTPEGRHVKRPQVGGVLIEDEVEIGANACVDRATFGLTRICRGAKIDNMVQVAHNVEIGPHCIVVAQAGIAGSTVLGRNVVIAAQAGVAGHLHLGDGVMVAAMAGVHNDQSPGARIGGAPAFEARQWARSCAAYARLPEMVKELRELRRRLAALEAGTQASETKGRTA
ncbi:MAG: UDP-3-O-(3-hydroxymyristoyl)glucosamine N-acyltransferase [Desulfobulbaceae bacterium A2]|nr:MAG: UDP-3-O-(3-hydroxymyristoyl)glucosamine N-acyltransferase [Desulfobulbaceae bacterium A2]